MGGLKDGRRAPRARGADGEAPRTTPQRRHVLGLGAAAFAAGGRGAATARAQGAARTPPSLLRHSPGDLHFTNAEGKRISHLAGTRASSASPPQ